MNYPLRIALYEPDIPQNTGAILRTAACLNLGVDIIEPCGFILGSSRMRRSAMDYAKKVDLVQHESWEEFKSFYKTSRLILLTTKAPLPHFNLRFEVGDILILGSETKGVPPQVHRAVNHQARIPMAPKMRCLNIAQATAIVVGESLRQLNKYPDQNQNPQNFT